MDRKVTFLVLCFCKMFHDEKIDDEAWERNLQNGKDINGKRLG
jgi:uncharacterized membrane protein